MKMKVMLSVFLINIFHCSPVLTEDSIIWKRQLMLQNDSVWIYWTFSSTSITFKVTVKTNGWIGFGFSPNGKMKGSDVVIGWVKDGKPFFKDRHAEGHFAPIIDEQQNYKLISGTENETHTSFTFERIFNTCDINDFILTNATIRIIYAWNNIDPPDEDSIIKHHHRGTTSVNLFNKDKPKIKMTKDITVWPVLMPNITLSSAITTYWCKYFKLPESNIKQHYIGFDVKFSPEMEGIVHHLMFYQCPGKSFEAEIDKNGFECLTTDVMTDCITPLLGWAIGGEGQVLPENVGFLVGEKYGGSTYFLLQIHYNNHEQKPNLVDSSGVNVYLTNTERPITGSILVSNSKSNYTMVIPPRQSSFKVTNYCPFHCTKGLPASGIYIFTLLLHGHIHMRKAKLRHFRDGKELPNIIDNKNYDFEYQEPFYLQEHVHILPGDSFLTECEYDTKNLDHPVLGGPRTTDEMCLAFICYYPMTNFSGCASIPYPNKILKYFGVEELQSDNSNVKLPRNLTNKSMKDVVLNFNWDAQSNEKIKEMQSIQLGPKQGICLDAFGNHSVTFKVKYPGLSKDKEVPCKKTII